MRARQSCCTAGDRQEFTPRNIKGQRDGPTFIAQCPQSDNDALLAGIR